MTTEVFTNDGASTLAVAVDGALGQITVASATTFPTTGQFRIKIDNEYMLVTAVSSTVFTVTRGIEGSTAAAHAINATVRHVLTATGLSTAIIQYSNFFYYSYFG